MYDDVFVNRFDLRKYQHSAATFVVPDITTYFAVRAVAGSAGKALLPWYYALFAVLVGSAAWALRGTAGPAMRAWIGPAAVVVGAVYVALIADFPGTIAAESYILLLPTNHAGAQACAFVALGLAARYFRNPRAWFAVGLAIVCGAATFSDRLFGLYFAAPIGLSALALRLIGSPGFSWRATAVVVASVAVGCGIGIGGIKLLPNPGIGEDPIGMYTGKPPALADLPGRLATLLAAARVEFLAGNVLVISAAGWAVVAAGGVGVAIRRRASPGLYPVYGLFAFAAVIVGFATSAAGAQELDRPGHNWASYSRYFAGPAAVGLFGWAGVAAAGVAAGGFRRAIAVLVPVASAFGLLAAGASNTPREGYDPLDEYPDCVRVIDETCLRYGMTDGLAGYWQAKPATVFSRAGVRVHAVDWKPLDRDPIRPFVWLTNADGFFRRPGKADGRPRFQFVVAYCPDTPRSARDFTTEDVARYLGPPVESVPAGPFAVMVYNRPGDKTLADLATRGPAFQALWSRTHPPRPGTAVWYAGASFSAVSAYEDVGTARAAESPQHGAGFFAFGPYVPAGRVGRYYAEFRVATKGGPGPVAKVDVFSDGTATGSSGRLAAADVPPGLDGVVRLEFDIPPGLVKQPLEFRVEFCGRGRIRFDGVAFGEVDVKAGK